MVNMGVLKNRIEESGLTMTSLARKSKIRRETLYNRLNGIGEFTASEIVGISEALYLTKEDRDFIFFNSKVELKSTKWKKDLWK